MQKVLAEYFKTQPVLKAWLFGSYARGEETPKSDVDILFVPDRSEQPFTLFTMGKIYMDLRNLLGKDVDLVTPYQLTDNEEFLKRVLNDAIKIYKKEK